MKLLNITLALNTQGKKDVAANYAQMTHKSVVMFFGGLPNLCFLCVFMPSSKIFLYNLGNNES